MDTKPGIVTPVRFTLNFNVMSDFKLNRNWNGHFAGEIVPVPNHLDGEMIRNRIGERIEKMKPIEIKAIEKAPKNKAVLNTPKKKRNVRGK